MAVLQMFWKKLFLFHRKKNEDIAEKPAEEKSFLLYTRYAPQILTWFRREKGIPKKDLQLAVIDDEEQPAWKVIRLLEILMTDLNLLYLITKRGEAFEELAEQAYEENGLLILIQEEDEDGNIPGNPVLDLRDWEKHLDIISEVGYNTLIM